MIGFQMMQSWAKSFNIQPVPLPPFIGLLYTDSYPNYYYICLSDLNPENPIVWSTDHEVFFTDVTNEGALEDFLNKFMTKEEFIDIVKRKLEQ